MSVNALDQQSVAEVLQTFNTGVTLLRWLIAVQVRGSITYNGEPFDSFQVARTCAYISQVDEHQAELTVRETFDFAARCLGTGHKQGRQHCLGGHASSRLSCAELLRCAA